MIKFIGVPISTAQLDFLFQNDFFHVEPKKNPFHRRKTTDFKGVIFDDVLKSGVIYPLEGNRWCFDAFNSFLTSQMHQKNGYITRIDSAYATGLSQSLWTDLHEFHSCLCAQAR